MSVWSVLVLGIFIVLLVGIFVLLVVFNVFHDIRNDVDKIIVTIESNVDRVFISSPPRPDQIIAYGDDLPTNIPPTPAFDLSTALFCGRVILSLSNELKGKDPMYPPQFTKVLTIGNSQAVLLRRRKSVGYFYVLGFRGTATEQDVFADINVPLTTYVSLNGNTIPGAMVQSGAYKEWIALKSQLLEVQDMIRENDTILICGHSLGGYFATLTSNSFSEMIDSSRMSFYCYESINSGNQAFFDAAEESVPNHWYIRNMMDIVPEFPWPVTVTLGNTSLYAYPRRLIILNGNTGDLVGNHNISTNMCLLNPYQQIPECPAFFAWTKEPQQLNPPT